MAQGLLCDRCELGRKAKKYEIVVREHGNAVAPITMSCVADLCPTDLTQVLKKIDAAIVPPKKRSKENDNA